jgi:hypothetical protein
LCVCMYVCVYIHILHFLYPFSHCWVPLLILQLVCCK